MKKIVLTFLISLCLLNFLEADEKYRVVPLNPPESLTGSHGSDINELGQVVGVYRKDVYYSVTFLWDKKNGFQEIASMELGSLMQIVFPKINNLGHVTGGIIGGGGWLIGYERPFLWTPETGLEELSPPKISGRHVRPIAINDHDQLLMMSIDQDSQRYPEKFWIWHEGEFEELKGMNPKYISNEQIITGVKLRPLSWWEGWLFDEDLLFGKPLVYDYQDKTEMIPLAAGMEKGDVLMINQRGEYIVNCWKNIGWFGIEEKYYYGYQDELKELPEKFEAVSINNFGEILGIIPKKEESPSVYIYRDEKLQKIELLSDDPNYKGIHSVKKMNDRGYIVGTAHYINSYGKPSVYAVLLVPVLD